MKTWPLRLWLLLSLFGATTVAAQSQPPLAAKPAGSADASAARPSVPLFQDDDLLLVEVRAGLDQLTDSLSAYSSRSGVYLPIGELARILDLAITVYPPEQKAKGWVLKESRTLSVDIRAHSARLGDQSLPIGADQGMFHADDIYLRLDLLEKLLPLGLQFDSRALVLRLQPREPLPFQLRLERERRRREIGGYTDKVSVLKVQTPYLGLTPPSLDITLNAGAGAVSPHATGQYDLRAAGDLAFAAMQFFAASDDNGRLEDVRLSLGRRDYDGRLFGPIRATAFEAGDTFTPSLALGARGVGGRGAFVTSRPLSSANVFSHLDLRGELQDGWQVELYVNEVLRASQTTAIAGRYEFLNVPLSFGANSLRMVFYGPHGEQREEVRHYNFGSGQLDKGQFTFDLAAVQEGEALIRVPPVLGPGGLTTPPAAGQGTLRAVAAFDYGLTKTLTVVGGIAQYTPVRDRTRRVIQGGVRTSIGSMALGLDLARDLEGGEAASLNLAGRLAGVTVFARDSEYQGIFYDEDQRSGIAGGTFLRRSTELRLDWVERVFRLGSGIPMSFDVQRDEKQDGATSTTADARFSMTPGGLFLSSSLRYSRTTGHEGASDVLAGAIDSSRLLAANWQVRGGLQYALLPQPEAQSVFVTVDHALSARNSIRLSISQALSTDFSTSVQLADTWRLDRAALSFAAGFDSQRRDFRLGVQLSFGLLFDPTRGRYRISRPGVTSGGDAVFTAFIDSNGDGRRETGEPALANLKLEVPGPKVVTDATGQALVSGLGASAAARIRVKTDDLDEPYAVPPADVVEFRPRPGRVTQIFYGLKPVGEVQLRLTIRRSGGQPKGVSGLDVQLLSAGNVVAAEGHTEYDGTMFVEKLPPGPYDVRIDPDQSKRLGLRLAKPLVVRVPPAGGFLGNVDGTVEAVS